MSKIMSVLEKLNVVEKVNNNMSNNPTNSSNATVKELENLHLDEIAATISNDYQVTEKKDPVSESDEQKSKKIHKPVNYDKNIGVNEIYSRFNIPNSNINTVFMLGNFINALPENLPSEVKKDSVINILNASNTNLDNLLSDGDERLNALNQFSNDYFGNITDTISGFKSEIAKLEKMISDYEKNIKLNENMLDEQNHIIKYEVQKINNILGFFRSAK